MRNYKLFICLALLGSVLFSCDDEQKDNLTDSKVYIVASGLQEIEVYKTGSPHTYQLGVYKAGAVKSSGTARLAVLTESELTDYNTTNATSYRLLPAACYEVSSLDVSFSSDVKDVNAVVDVVFDPEQIAGLQGDGYVLPIKIESASFGINENKSVCILYPEVVSTTVSFTSPLKQYSYETGSEDVSLSATVAFSASNEWNIECEVAVDEAYVNEYNASTGQDYILLPAGMYTLQEKATIASGSKEAAFNLVVKVSGLEAGLYMLPVRLSTVSMFDINEAANLHVVSIKIGAPELLDRANWTISANTEELVGEGAPNGWASSLLDGDYGTFWHAQWQDGWQDLPHEIIIDMQQEHTISAVYLVDRQGKHDTHGGEFLISTNNISWTKVGEFALDGSDDLQIFSVTKTKGRYLMIKITAANGTNSSLAEVMPYGI